jgi:hypothetical protein
MEGYSFHPSFRISELSYIVSGTIRNLFKTIFREEKGMLIVDIFDL